MNKFIFILIFQAAVFFAGAQTVDSAAMVRLRALIRGEKEKSAAEFFSEKVERQQEQALEKVLQYNRTAREYLKNGIDTAVLEENIAEIREKLVVAGKGIFTEEGMLKTHRNLTTTSKIISQLQHEAEIRKDRIDTYKQKLTDFRDNMDSLLTDSVLFVASDDSAQFARYLQKLVRTAREVHPVDSMLEQSIKKMQMLKDDAGNLMFEITAALDRIEREEMLLSNRSFEKEIPYLWQPQPPSPDLDVIAVRAVEKAVLNLTYYTVNNAGRIALMLLLIVMAAVFISALKHKAATGGIIRTDYTGQLVIRYPVLSALLIVISIFQFIFPEPPFIFSCCLWLVSTASLTWIFMGFISRYWMSFWLSMWMLFLLACADNLVLQIAPAERWLMFFIALCGLVIGLLVLSGKHRLWLREKAIVYFIICFIIIEVLAVAANTYGRFNLSKSLLASGYINLIIAISFLWTVRLINEGLMLASQMFQTPERRLFYINFNMIGSKAPMFLYVFLVIGWFIILARNFFEFRFLTEPVKNFIYDEISVGDYSFSIYSIVSFFVVLIIAAVISRIISFFGTDSYASSKDINEKSGLGSWILLIRIFIIIMGAVLAFAVAGIPLDKATIVLGALGVGIGFGFQALVQNLVSGIILTFEKPVNVGDFVEIKGQAGTIKSIGFRSSVLMTLEGSSVIIPNGEILNDNVINWTHERGMTRRTEITIGVAYGTDLEKAREILLMLTDAHGSVLKSPAPFVLMTEFANSSVNLQVFFWASTPIAGRFIKSELIIEIQKAFKENNIIIPFPQQDVYIKQFPAEEKQGSEL